jgi:superfamily II DNA or RNA helicase
MTTNEAPRQRLIFSWDCVDIRIIQAMLAAAYSDELDDLDRLTGEGRWRQQAHRTFGSPPAMKALDASPETWRVLLDAWLIKSASHDDLRDLFHYVRRTLSPSQRQLNVESKSELRRFFSQRRLTENLKANLRRQFIRAHRRKRMVRSSSHSPTGETRRGVITLVGLGDPPSRTPYRHQLDAWAGLDALRRARAADKRRGLVVLPTGAGKTWTTAHWVLDQLARSPKIRVLWLAHQQELLEQAASELTNVARALPNGFSRRLRLISSAHSPITTVVDDKLDIALVTWQSLRGSWAQRDQRRLQRFLERPTIVVVDEAHHAGAKGYQQVLAMINAAPQVVVIGLSATPWPTGTAAVGRVRETFPVDIVTVRPADLHTSGILATPVMHAVDTGATIELTAAERRLARGDLPPAVLRRLATEQRDGVIVRTWIEQQQEWCKTLVFATSKAHADSLGERFRQRGIDVGVLHSGIVEDRADVLRWFREAKEPCILVSVGMLTEGVDLPDARTAILARPTTSQILMRQMVGRVLRGPAAGGDADAHVIYLRDRWPGFDDIFEPMEMPDLDGGATSDSSDHATYRLPSILDEATGDPIGEDVLAQIRRMYSARVDRLPIDPASMSSRLVGFYETGDVNVPVMEHQRDGYHVLIRRALRGESFQGATPKAIFDDDYPPYPTQRGLNAVLEYTRANGTPPPFHPLEAAITPRSIAAELQELRKTDRERRVWLRRRFDSSLARLAYRSFDHFEEAVQRELRDLPGDVQDGRRRINPERHEPPRDDEERPKLRRAQSRPVPDLKSVLTTVREVLAGEPAIRHLSEQDLPTVKWTNDSIESVWAYWSLKTTGKGAGKPAIRINRALQAPATQVSDELLEYLVFHELLHDVFPGQGHTAEFRRLEGMWPNAEQLDLALDTVSERYSIPIRRH